MTRSITRPITRSITRGITEGIGGGATALPYQALLDLNPTLLTIINDAYAEGRLWQDSAMTTPATAVDDPVGCAEDLSGNGYHFTASGTARPLLKQDGDGNYYLLPDGVNDTMATSAIDLTGTQAITISRAFVAPAPASGITCFLSSSSSPEGTAGAFEVFDDYYSGFVFLATGNAGYSSALIAQPTEGAAYTSSMVCDFSLASAEVSVVTMNNASAITGRTHNSNNTGAFGNHAMHLFSQGGGDKFSTVPMYGVAILPAAASPGEIAVIETYLASQSGVTL